MIIYYNPECSKCQQAVALLENANCSFQIREYLKQAPDVAELKELVKLIGCKPADLIRKKENLYQEKFALKTISDDEIFDMLSRHPELIERPIVIDGERAIIGRPPELIIEFVKKPAQH